jgi:hypothetical protein
MVKVVLVVVAGIVKTATKTEMTFHDFLLAFNNDSVKLSWLHPIAPKFRAFVEHKVGNGRGVCKTLVLVSGIYLQVQALS